MRELRSEAGMTRIRPGRRRSASRGRPSTRSRAVATFRRCRWRSASLDLFDGSGADLRSGGGGRMMREDSRSGHRGASAAVLLVVGGAVAAAAWIGGHPGVAAAMIGVYVVLAVIALIWSGGRGDVAAIMRGSGDERQRALNLRATAAAGVVTSFVAIWRCDREHRANRGEPGTVRRDPLDGARHQLRRRARRPPLARLTATGARAGAGSIDPAPVHPSSGKTSSGYFQPVISRIVA